MTYKELKKIIEDEVSAATPDKPEIWKEPTLPIPQRPRYKPVLRTEEEIDNMFFYAGDKPQED